MILTIVFWTVLLIINAVWVMTHPWVMPVYAMLLYGVVSLVIGLGVIIFQMRKNRID